MNNNYPANTLIEMQHRMTLKSHIDNAAHIQLELLANGANIKESNRILSKLTTKGDKQAFKLFILTCIGGNETNKHELL
ncbi:hypothetical protein AB4238_13570 [Shewanella sp. 10N.286.45.A1]|uniref:hypothetical protein n=1 Tax=Shewanella sp. 10N.286.45.A1 TaxID=3229694 RepID=UPI0035527BD6